MIAAEEAGLPCVTSLDDLWSCVAFDPMGEFRGYGFGHNPSEAQAGAWITVWCPEYELTAVPLNVPKGWTFKTYAPGNGPLFVKT